MSIHKLKKWSVIDGYYPGFREISGPSFKISVVVGAADITTEQSLQREAEVRLIAAAPEMLSLLRQVHRGAVHLVTSGSTDDLKQFTSNFLHIAALTGELIKDLGSLRFDVAEVKDEPKSN